MTPRATGPAWLLPVGAALHLALAVLVAGSAVILLLGRGEDGSGLIAGWTGTLGTILDGIASERRRPFALALLAAAAALPLLVGWWDGRRARQGRGGPGIVLTAALAALACVALYAAAVQGLVLARGAYVTIIARAQLFGSHILLGLYALVYVAVSPLAGWLLRRLHRRPGAGAG